MLHDLADLRIRALPDTAAAGADVVILLLIACDDVSMPESGRPRDSASGDTGDSPARTDTDPGETADTFDDIPWCQSQYW